MFNDNRHYLDFLRCPIGVFGVSGSWGLCSVSRASGCRLYSCVEPAFVLFLFQHQWARKTGSCPSCPMKTAGQEDIKSTHCCRCLQRLHSPESTGKANRLHIVDITVRLQKLQDCTQIRILKTWRRHDRDIACIFVAGWKAVSGRVLPGPAQSLLQLKVFFVFFFYAPP